MSKLSNQIEQVMRIKEKMTNKECVDVSTNSLNQIQRDCMENIEEIMYAYNYQGLKGQQQMTLYC